MIVGDPPLFVEEVLLLFPKRPCRPQPFMVKLRHKEKTINKNRNFLKGYTLLSKTLIQFFRLVSPRRHKKCSKKGDL